MPFRTTNIPPPTNAKVTVTFAGLMLLKPGANDSCEIGIHRFTNTHTFQVMLVVNKPNRPPRLIRLLTGPLTDTFEMTVAPAPSTRFQAFAFTDGDLDRADVNNHPLDYRWSFNLRALHPNSDFNHGARPVVTLNAGVLYTPNLTRDGLRLELVHEETIDDLHKLGADLAAAIDLSAGSTMVIGWRELGEPQSVTLPRDGDPPDTTYTISLLNDPPISSPAAHDELALYYKVLEVAGAPITNDDRRRLEVGNAQKSDEIPCLPVVLEP